MGLRIPLTTSFQDPPEGTIRIAFCRHLTSHSDDPELVDLHKQRALIVHQLVDTAGIEVRSWGNVEAERSAEVVEIIVAAFAAPVATKVVNYLWTKIRPRRKKTDEVLKAVTLRRPDGAELVWEFTGAVSAKTAHEEIEKFLQGDSIEKSPIQWLTRSRSGWTNPIAARVV